MTRLPLRTRLAVTFGLLFVLAGGGVIALTVTLAVHSVGAAHRANAPAVRDLKSSIAEALAGQVRADSPTDVNGTDTGPSAAKKLEAAQAEEMTKTRLLDANRAYTEATSSDAQRRLVLWSALAAAVMLPAAAATGWVLSRRALRPLHAMGESVRRVSDSSLSERVGMVGPRDELTDLASSFDAMLERLEHAFDAQRRFAADASHELRTPLAVAATAVDVVLAKPDPSPEQWRRMAVDVRTSVDRTEAVLEGLLTLTRTQNLDHRREPVDLAGLLRETVASYASDLADLEVSSVLAAAPVVGDPALLQRLLANLVENAARHNVAGGSVQVVSGVDGESAVVEISSTGHELSAEQVEELTTPFFRAAGRAHSRDGGLGLGLAIAKAVVEAHHGTLVPTPRAGGGLVVEVRIPVLR
ncbi:MAG: ATP-binding protein [Marmoricola sp.]